MQQFDEILSAARRLSEAERRRLIAELKAEEAAPQPRLERREAMRRWVESAGTGHSDFDDVASNKNEHLADIYATKP